MQISYKIYLNYVKSQCDQISTGNFYSTFLFNDHSEMELNSDKYCMLGQVPNLNPTWTYSSLF